MAKELWQMLAGYLLLVNLAAFFMMWADKRRARKGRWRLSEKAFFRHKTRHWYFRFGLPALLLLQAAGLCWLIIRLR